MSNLTGISDVIIKRLVFDVVLANLMKRLVAKFVFLGWWWVNPIFAYFMTKAAEAIYDELALSVGFYLIDAKIGEQKKDYEEATEKLQDAISKGEQDAIDKAKEEYKAKLRALIKYNK